MCQARAGTLQNPGPLPQSRPPGPASGFKQTFSCMLLRSDHADAQAPPQFTDEGAIISIASVWQGGVQKMALSNGHRESSNNGPPVRDKGTMVCRVEDRSLQTQNCTTAFSRQAETPRLAILFSARTGKVKCSVAVCVNARAGTYEPGLRPKSVTSPGAKLLEGCLCACGRVERAP